VSPTLRLAHSPTPDATPVGRSDTYRPPPRVPLLLRGTRCVWRGSSYRCLPPNLLCVHVQLRVRHSNRRLRASADGLVAAVPTPVADQGVSLPHSSSPHHCAPIFEPVSLRTSRIYVSKPHLLSIVSPHNLPQRQLCGRPPRSQSLWVIPSPPPSRLARSLTARSALNMVHS
jgi:hypothetical protein